MTELDDLKTKLSPEEDAWKELVPKEIVSVGQLQPYHVGRFIRAHTKAPERKADNQVWVAGVLEYILHDPKGAPMYDTKNRRMPGRFQPATDQLKIGGVTFSFAHDVNLEVY
jgi:hypothetical protein